MKEGRQVVSWPCALLIPGEGEAQAQMQRWKARAALVWTGRQAPDHEEMKTSQGLKQEVTRSKPPFN